MSNSIGTFINELTAYTGAVTDLVLPAMPAGAPPVSGNTYSIPVSSIIAAAAGQGSGQPGPAGTSLYAGDGTPTAVGQTGNNGDHYLDLTTGEFWVYSTSAGWTDTGNNIVALIGSGTPPTGVTIVTAPKADQVVQRDTRTGGPTGFGVGAIPITLLLPAAVSTLSWRLRDFTSGAVVLNWASLGAQPAGYLSPVISGPAASRDYIVDFATNGSTTPAASTTANFAIGEVLCLWGGQDLNAMLQARYAPNTTIAAAVPNVSPWGRMYAGFTDTSSALGDAAVNVTVPGGWGVPVDGSNLGYTGCGAAEMLRILVARTGVAWGLIAYADGGASVTTWQPGDTNLNVLEAMLYANGAKIGVLGKLQGIVDMVAAIGGTTYGTDETATHSDIRAKFGTAFAFDEFVAANADILSQSTLGVPTDAATDAIMQADATYAAADAHPTQNVATLRGIAMNTTDYYHPLQTGCVQMAAHIARAICKVIGLEPNGDNGPVIGAATRAQNSNQIVVPVTANDSATITLDTAPGTLYCPYRVFDGSTEVSVTGLSYAAGVLTMTLATTPANSDALIIRPFYGVASPHQWNQFLRDNYTMGVPGISEGRHITYVAAGITVPAPGTVSGVAMTSAVVAADGMTTTLNFSQAVTLATIADLTVKINGALVNFTNTDAATSLSAHVISLSTSAYAGDAVTLAISNVALTSPALAATTAPSVVNNSALTHPNPDSGAFTSTANLLAWYDAANTLNTPSILDDKGPNSYDGTQSVTASQPAVVPGPNGISVMQFNNSYFILDTLAAAIAGAPRDLHFFIALEATPASTFPISIGFADANDGPFGGTNPFADWLQMQTSGSPAVWAGGRKTPNTTNYIATTIPVASAGTTWQILEFVQRADGSQAWALNGGTYQLSTTDCTDTITWIYGTLGGWRSGSPAVFASGIVMKFAELGIVARYISSSIERSAILNAMNTFRGLGLTIGSGPPEATFNSAVVASNGTTLTLTFSEAVTLPNAAALTATVNGVAAPMTNADAGTSSATHVYTFTSVVDTGQTVVLTVANTNMTSPILVGTTAPAVTNGSSQGSSAPVFTAASVAADGVTLTVTFNEAVTLPTPADLTAEVNGTSRAITNTDGATSLAAHVYTLTSAANVGDVITLAVSSVNWTAPALGVTSPPSVSNNSNQGSGSSGIVTGDSTLGTLVVASPAPTITDGFTTGGIYGPTTIYGDLNEGEQSSFGEWFVRGLTGAPEWSLSGTDAALFYFYGNGDPTRNGTQIRGDLYYSPQKSSYSFTISATDGTTTYNLAVTMLAGTQWLQFDRWYLLGDATQKIDGYGGSGPTQNAYYVSNGKQGGINSIISGISSPDGLLTSTTPSYGSFIWTTEAANPIASHYGTHTATITDNNNVTYTYECWFIQELPPVCRFVQAATGVLYSNAPQGQLFGQCYGYSDAGISSFSISTPNNFLTLNPSNELVVGQTQPAGNYTAELTITSSTGQQEILNIPFVVQVGTVLDASNMVVSGIATGIDNSMLAQTVATVTQSGMSTPTFAVSEPSGDAGNTSLYVAGGSTQPRWTITASGNVATVHGAFFSAGTYTLLVTAVDGALSCQNTFSFTVAAVSGPTITVNNTLTPSSTVFPTWNAWNDAFIGALSTYEGSIVNLAQQDYSTDFSTLVPGHGNNEEWPPGPATYVGVSPSNRTVINYHNLDAPDDKGLITCNSYDLTVMNLEIMGVNGGNNQAAFTHENVTAGDLKVSDCFVHNCCNGYFVGSDGVRLTFTNFVTAYNGCGSYGTTHNFYCTNCEELISTNCLSYGMGGAGHGWKTRGQRGTINGLRSIDGENGGMSVQLDMPALGTYLVENCTMMKGPNANNGTILEYGEEYPPNTTNPINLTRFKVDINNNTFIIACDNSIVQNDQMDAATAMQIGFFYQSSMLNAITGRGPVIRYANNKFFGIQTGLRIVDYSRPPSTTNVKIIDGGGNVDITTWVDLQAIDPSTGSLMTSVPYPPVSYGNFGPYLWFDANALQYRIAVGAPVGSIIGTATGIDANGNAMTGQTFSLANNDSGNFAINPSTGQFYVNSTSIPDSIRYILVESTGTGATSSGGSSGSFSVAKWAFIVVGNGTLVINPPTVAQPGQLTGVSVASTTGSTVTLTWSNPTTGGAPATYDVSWTDNPLDQVGGLDVAWYEQPVPGGSFGPTGGTATGLPPSDTMILYCYAVNAGGRGPCTILTGVQTAGSGPPVVAISSATIASNGTTLTLIFSTPVTLVAADITATLGGAVIALSNSDAGTSSVTHVFTMGSTIATGQTVVLSVSTTAFSSPALAAATAPTVNNTSTQAVPGATSPVLLHANGAYLVNPTNKAVVLTSNHTWNDLFDTTYAGTFDFGAYVTFLTGNGDNLIRGWAWEAPTDGGGSLGTWTPFRYAGSTPYDLTKLNQAYFDRIIARATAAAAAGIYLSVMCFNGTSVSTTGAWSTHPFKSSNNVNSINGDPGSSGYGYLTQQQTSGAIWNFQTAFLDKLIASLSGFSNVLFEVANECADDTATRAWQNAVAAYIHTKEIAGTGFHHPVCISAPYPPATSNADTNAFLFGSNADWITLAGTTADGSGAGVDYEAYDQLVNPGTKPAGLDTDHIYGAGGAWEWVWTSFLRGYIDILYMDYLDGLGITGSYPGGSAQAGNETAAQGAMKQMRTVAGILDFTTMTPSSTLASTGYCMKDTTNAQFCVFQPANAAFTLDLSGVPGQNMNVQWLELSNGTLSSITSVTGGSSAESFTPPYPQSVLMLTKGSTVPGTGNSNAFTGTANLLQWVSADNASNTSTTIADKSGNGANLTTTTGVPPTVLTSAQNGYNLLNFDGSTNWLLDASFGTALDGMPTVDRHFFFVVETPASNAYPIIWQAFTSADSSQSTYPLFFGFYVQSATYGAGWVGGYEDFSNSTASLFSTTSAIPQPDGNMHLVEVINHANGTCSVAVDGSAYQTSGTSSSDSESGWGACFGVQGAADGSVARFCQMKLAEHAKVGRVLTSTELQTACQTLSNHWGLGLTIALR